MESIFPLFSTQNVLLWKGRCREMIRILQSVNIMDRAGLETMLMNYYRKIDHTKIQFDFLTHRPDRGAYDDEIEAMGGHIYHAPRLYPQNYPAYYRYMKQFFAEHPEYRIIHSHIDAMSAFPLLAAKISHIPHRIAHSHTSKLDKDLKLPIKFTALKCMPYLANIYCACGEVAGRFMFPTQEFRLIRNAIDLDRFRFDPQLRQNVRSAQGWENKLVIGHVGRFCYIKNQLFLLDVFQKILETQDNCHLVLIGSGEDEQKIREKIVALNLTDNVSVLINRPDVDALYQAMDIFVMPSLFEGLPMVAVEAQANGLPCIFSDKISKEALLTDNAKMLSLASGVERWAEEILNTNIERNSDAAKQLQEMGYDINTEVQKLQAWYEQLSEN